MEFTLFSGLKELVLSDWVSLGIAAVLAVALVAFVVRGKRVGAEAPEPLGRVDSTRAVVYGALCVALSFLLSYIKVLTMPQGGSITVASVLPLALYAYWFGPRQGIIAGVAAGILQFIQEPYIVHYLQPILDYALAFGCFGLAGLRVFRRNRDFGLPLGLLAGGIGRCLCSVVSGVVFFAEYAPAGQNVWLYSLGYNLGYAGPDILVALIIATLPPIRRLLERIRPR